tara:strand:+ start:85 stop:546 length:462 start_codon:yes stop_codon:yes gene_type:complete
MSVTIEETPLFLQENGEDKISEIRKELEAYVKVLNKNPLELIQKTFISLNNAALSTQWASEEEVDKIKCWWNNPATQPRIIEWLVSGKHKVNGKFGNWSAGFLGSRWADCEINGRRCRFAFYSRKHNSTSFTPQMEKDLGKRYDYALHIDPTY